MFAKSIQTRHIEELRTAINEIEGPHEHGEGMNECAVCDEPIIRAAVRVLKRLRDERRILLDAVAHIGMQSEDRLMSEFAIQQLERVLP